jgi:hypothetical protein
MLCHLCTDKVCIRYSVVAEILSVMGEDVVLFAYKFSV